MVKIIASQTLKGPRPYWHVDAKWLSALILIPVLAATLWIFNLMQLTRRGPAVEILTRVIAVSFSREGMDDTMSIEALKKEIEKSKTGSIKPIIGLNIEVSKSDLLGKTPAEIRLNLFRKIVEPIYDLGGDASKVLADTTLQTDEPPQFNLGVASFLTKKGHETITKIFFGVLAAGALLMGLVIFFSAGLGRLFSPGILLFFVSLHGTILSLAGKGFIINNPPFGGPLPEENYAALITTGASWVLPVVVPELFRNFLAATALGLLLLLFAGGIKLVKHFKKKNAEPEHKKDN